MEGVAMRSHPTGPAIVLAALLLIAGCSSDGEAANETSTTVLATTTTGTPAPTVAAPETVNSTASTAQLLRLTFDGETCTYEGPTQLRPGPAELIYTNDSQGKAWVALNRHNGDETIQDAVDHFGPSPSPTPCPDWKSDVARSSVAPGETYRWEGDLETATHHMVCYQTSPLQVWFGTGLTVEG
jgi:hypothetical protein